LKYLIQIKLKRLKSYIHFKNRTFLKMLKIEKIEIRGYIRIRNLLGISAKDIIKELKASLSTQAPSEMTVYRWIKLFKSGEESLEDQQRSGRPNTAVNHVNIQKIKQLVEENPHITYAEIEAETLLNPPSIQTILKSSLGLRKIASRWVPHELTKAQKQKRVECCQENLRLVNEGKIRLCDIFTGDESWIYHRKIESKKSSAAWLKPGQSPKVIVKRNQFEPKSMFSVFFKTTGVLHIDCACKGEKIDNNYYIENCLKPVILAIKNDRIVSGTKQMKILHDNARPHVHQNVDNFLKDNGIAKIQHPPYSPDLAPCDFWLFDMLKKELTSQPDARSLKNEVTRILSQVDKKEFAKTFYKWLERMQCCINNKGEYFEHLIK
jgi:histone-lysine N-methyltransferase SETMAR